jgi:hypothetical protein
VFGTKSISSEFFQLLGKQKIRCPDDASLNNAPLDDAALDDVPLG